MGKLTAHLPKPLLPVHGKPMLAHILEGLATYGMTEVLIVVGHGREAIEQQFANWPTPLEFKVQSPVNGTGSAALLAKSFVGEEPFLLTYGDILCAPAEYKRCADVLMARQETVAVLAVKAVDDPWQGAAVYEQDGRIYEIIEKPPKGTSKTRWNSAGIYTFRPALFQYLQKVRPSARDEFELTSALENMVQLGLDLRISAIEGEWHDVGRPEDLQGVNG
jgi:dTDP-glucose pyrophosphorylase